MDKVIPVRVAVRCRPLITKEKNEGCETCLSFIPGEEQVVLGRDKSFTFDYVFTPDTPQVEVYERAVSKLVEGIFKGYNATVLAYGQTGSGKTFSMGGGYEISLDTSNDVVGIIPRVIKQLFEGIEEASQFTFVVRVSYLEIYKEELIDLLLAHPVKDSVTIREFEAGNIKLVGLTERVVESPVEMIKCLTDGAANRTTAATAMNNESSRSHAIFTVYIDKTNKNETQDFTRSKFHLVDLAGSERQKKTKAEGERLKEGININKGLLALGNVISALGDEVQRAKYVPYRDSKLTRLLQDSLGGNSHTVMIACCSPADSNMEETLSTLRYADRARKIKNKPIVNRDPNVAEIMRLKNIIRDLQVQMVSEGIAIKNVESIPQVGQGDVKVDAQTLEELKTLRNKNKELEYRLAVLRHDLELAWEQNQLQTAKVMILEGQKEAAQDEITDLKKEVERVLAEIEARINESGNSTGVDLLNMTRNLTKTWQQRIEKIENIQNLEGDYDRILNQSSSTENHGEEATETPEEGTTAVDHDDEITDSQLSECVQATQEQRRDKTAKLIRELNELNRNMNAKEDLLKKMSSNSPEFERIRSEHEQAIKEKEDLIHRLQTEKEELENQLKQSKVDVKLNKVNEARRKKIQELEQELKDQKRTLAETNKMLKVKENSTKDMDRLKRDILEMKQQRVRLMKQIKADSEEFRKFKQQKDREVIQLKAQECKRMAEMNKLKGKFNIQQAILKRKNEEAAALSKRLNENLMKQRRAFEEKAKKEANTSESKKARIAKLINQELEFVVGVEEARQQKEEMVNDRKQLSEQLVALKEELEGSRSSKGQQLSYRSALDRDERTETLCRQIKDIEVQIQVKSSHIHDLQNQIMEADANANDRSKRPFYEDMRSMTEYRIGMTHLINKVKNSRIALIKQRSANEDSAQEADALQQKLEETQKELDELKREHDNEIMNVRSKYEGKINLLIGQLKRSAETASNASDSRLADKEMKDRTLLNEELQAVKRQYDVSQVRLEQLTQQMKEKDLEIHQLRKELTKKAYTSKVSQNQSLLPQLNETITYSKEATESPCTVVKEEDEEPTYFSNAMLTVPGISKKQKRRTLIFEEETSESEFDEEDAEDEELSDCDADWQEGRTPGYSKKWDSKHPRRSRLPPRMPSRSLLNRSDDRMSMESVASSGVGSPAGGTDGKLNSSLVKCCCRKSCSTKRCACFKADGRCGDHCRCAVGCENKELPLPESTTNDDEISQGSTMFNTTFVKDEDVSAKACLRDSTNTSRGSEEEAVPQPASKFRKSGEASRLAVSGGEENFASSDVSQDGLAKLSTQQRKRKLGKKTSQFFNPI